MKKTPRIMLAAGEVSGDMHGAALVRQLRARGAQVFGLGGAAMQAAGMRLDLDLSSRAVMGFVQVLANFRFFYRAMKKAKTLLDQEKPDLLVIIDNPGFNLPLARAARQKGIEVCAYISPQVWAWKKNRVHRMRRDLRRMLVIFPFEKQIYDKVGLDCRFVGHPLLDEIKPRLSVALARRRLGAAQSQKIVALLPGSRKQEITWMLPVMLKAATLLAEKDPQLRFVLLRAAGLEAGMYTQADNSDLPLIQIDSGMEKDIYGLRRVFDAVMVSSGTATLETAILGTPMVLLYRVHAWEYAVGRWLIQLPYIGLPNVLAGRRIIPELIQGRMTPGRVAAAVWECLVNPRFASRQKRDLKKAVSRLGKPGVARRVAAAILELVH